MEKCEGKVKAGSFRQLESAEHCDYFYINIFLDLYLSD